MSVSSAERTGIGPTYEFVVAVYLGAVVTVTGVGVLAIQGRPTEQLALALVAGSVDAVTGAGLIIGVAGLPRHVHPRPLYASSVAWFPAAVGGLPALGGLAGLVIGAPIKIVVPALFGGLIVAGLGWILLVMARNAEARARLAEAEPAEWSARPGPTGRRRWRAGALGCALAAVALAAGTRQPGFLAFVGSSLGLWGQTTEQRQFQLTDDVLVYGGPEAYYLLDRAAVTTVTLDAEELRLERRGWRPAITCATADMEAPETVVTALSDTRTASVAGR
ncbi:hypothetical protein [Halosegnis sp.]|uniref:hypothetical protein n=1 Tax=Halosegnis sp. TaxID=2864959 RepID=UPI0035D5285A